MQSQLYAVRIGGRWSWHVTLAVEVDIHHRFGQYAADAGIVVLEPFVSLGQASTLRRKLESYPELSSDAAELLKAVRHKATECGLPEVMVNELRLTEISYDTWPDGVIPPVQLDASAYKKLLAAIRGRSLLLEELGQLIEHHALRFNDESEWKRYVQYGYLQKELEITNGHELFERRQLPSLWKKSREYVCKRCGSGAERMFWSHCVFCKGECPYCEECLTMGRTRYCSLLVLGAENGRRFGARQEEADTLPLEAYLEPWGLSMAQSAASLEGLRFIRNSDGGAEAGGTRLHSHRYRGLLWRGGETAAAERSVFKRGEDSRQRLAPRSFLIWAVTGAGKTEMIFPFIQHELERGGRVLVATPRKDVVLELRPRLSRAFAGYSVVTLYGGCERRWEQGDLTIATTHQLMRFWQAFDLVIIDEIDAFPYHNNPILEHAARKVCKPSGNYILLSATPPAPLRRAASHGQLPHVKVPVRYHRHPLPVPELVAAPTLKQMLKAQSLPPQLHKRIQASLERGAQLFVFAPSIQLVEPLVHLLRKVFPAPGGSPLVIEGTSSKDPLRADKVQRFRDGGIRLLVTTTILERGVTVPKTDVFILDADSALFDDAALVQMAGRAGRSKDDPAGRVYFASKEKTKSQKEATRQIKGMNTIARKKGYLKGEQDDRK